MEVVEEPVPDSTLTVRIALCWGIPDYMDIQAELPMGTK